jgi:hypothetical protein
LTINTDRGSLSFRVDPGAGITDGYQVGDVVDVTYTTNSDGTFAPPTSRLSKPSRAVRSPQ